jgi:hypothetical protein
MEGSGYGVIEVMYRHLLGETGEKRRKPSVKMAEYKSRAMALQEPTRSVLK